MPKKFDRSSQQAVWTGVHNGFSDLFPQLSSVLNSTEDFIELRIKARDDGTSLAILKRFDADGGPSVLFGSGYGPIGSLLGLEGSVAANKWRVDKPWQPSPNGSEE